MAQRIEVPGHGIVEFPDGMSETDIASAIKRNMPTQQKESKPAVDIAGGILRGAGSIGATILAPIDWAARQAGIENGWIGRQDRREAMDAGLRTAGVNTESLPFKGAKLGTEIAGTLGVGGALGGALKGVPMLTKAAPGLAEAVKTGGFSAGGATGLPGIVTRVAGGALTGGTAAGLVNPEDALLGAGIGGGIQAGLPVIGVVRQGVTKALGGVSGVGDEVLGQAYKAGKAGGAADDAFVRNMRGQSSMDEVLETAKQNLQSMVKQKQDAYRSGMIDIKGDKSVIGFDGIDKAINDAFNVVSFKGQVKNTRAADALQEVADDIARWKNLDPAQYHTPEGLDALKQRIGATLESIPFEQKTARKAVGDIYNSIKTEINTQAPSYAKVMGDYSKASETISEIERALSLGQKASADTSIRKLQSLMRNNANTNYGNRLNLASQLEKAGGKEIMPALAGQSLNAWTPRGIQRAVAGTGGAGLAFTGNLPAAVGLGVVSSPRLLGEVYRGAGKVSGLLSPEEIAQASYLFSQIPQRAYFNAKK